MATATAAKTAPALDPASVQNRIRRGWGLNPLPDKAAENEQQRGKLYARSPFNKQVGKLITMLGKVLDEVRELAYDHDSGDIRIMWRNAGLPPLAEDDAMSHECLGVLEMLRRDAMALEWVVERFVGILEGHHAGVRRR